MFKHSLFLVMVFGIALGAAAAMNPIEVLQSDADLEKKVEACRLISISGDVNAIPVLESLLPNEELSAMARYALEPMPAGEADAALRRALGTTSGRLKAGVVASLGVRRDAAAVPEIIPLLKDADGFIVEAAIRSLGRIGTPECIDALTNAVSQPGLPFAVMCALGDGISFAAETALKVGNTGDAIRLYDAAYAAEGLPVHVRAAGLRGAILARAPQDGLPLLMDAIKGENPDFFIMALRTAIEIEGKGNVAKRIADILPSVAEERKIQVIQALGELGQKNAGAALLNEANVGSLPIRIAALRAAVRLGYEEVIPVLTVLLSAEDADLVRTAREGLSYFPGKAGDNTVLELLKSNDAQIRLTAVELVSQGALPTPADLLLELANNDAEEAVRLAALKGAKEYVGIPHLSTLLSHLLKPRSNDELAAAEEAIKLLCVREKAVTKEDIVIVRAVYGALQEGLQTDVTEKVKEMATAGVLSVGAHNGNFGEPAPGKVKQLLVEYTVKGTAASQTVQEGQSLNLAATSVPDTIVDALCEAFAAGEGPSKLAVMRILASTGNQKAFDLVLPLALSGEGELKETAIKAVCDWPTAVALPTLLEWIKAPANDTAKMNALRGIVRLLIPGQETNENLCGQYAALMAQAASANEKKLILSGLANIGSVCALNMVVEQVADEAVKAEAVAAAIAIAEKLGNSPQERDALKSARELIPELGRNRKK